MFSLFNLEAWLYEHDISINQSSERAATEMKANVYFHKKNPALLRSLLLL